MKILYTYGYSRGYRTDLQAYAQAGALILDTRFSPHSRNWLWKKESLQAVLPTGRYRWCQDLGNVNYKNGGPIQISNPELGLPIIAEALAQGPVILLCACGDPSTCHRTVVAELALEAGICSDVVHLLPGDPLEEIQTRELSLVSPVQRIRALTILQPWATLIAIGGKRIETRSWATDYRGPISIHAGKRFGEDCRDLTYHEPFNRVLRGHYGPTGSPDDLPLGAVVAVATLKDCVRTEDVNRKYGLTAQEDAFGDFSPGRYGWVLENVCRLETPIPAKGAQGLWWWDVPEDCEVQL